LGPVHALREEQAEASEGDSVTMCKRTKFRCDTRKKRMGGVKESGAKQRLSRTDFGFGWGRTTVEASSQEKEEV